MECARSAAAWLRARDRVRCVLGYWKDDLPPDDVRNFHLDVVNDIDEMKNPGAIGAPDGHVGVRLLARQIEIDFAVNEIVDDHVLARRAKAQRACVLENVTGVLQFAQILFVDGIAFALKSRIEIAAFVRARVPAESRASGGRPRITATASCAVARGCVGLRCAE